METLLGVATTLGLGTAAGFAGSVMVGMAKRREEARWHLYRELIPAAERALDTPEAIVDVDGMSSAIRDMKVASLTLGRRERRSIELIGCVENQRWALVGFGPAMGEKAMPEFHLKNQLRSELGRLRHLTERRLRWRLLERTCHA
jgi:hypothetical protein